MWGRLAEKAFTTSPQEWFVEDDRVVVLTDITLNGRPAKQADVWTLHDGRARRYEGVIDTAVYAAAYPN